MATTATLHSQFPAGTSVGAYPPSDRRDGRAPRGSAVTTATVASDGTLTFTGLEHETEYVAYASVGGVHTYVGFTTEPSQDQDVEGNIEVATDEYDGASSYQGVAADLNVGAGAGKSSGTAFLAGVMGNILGAVLTKTKNYLGGLIGHYNVTGSKATTYPAGAVLGGIGDGVTEADGAFVAYTDGDDSVTTAGAGFKVRNNNSTAASGFDYGVDLQDAAHDGFQPVDSAFYNKAPVRLVEDVVELVKNGAPTSGTSGDGAGFAGPGSRLTDTSGKKLYINTNTKASPTWTVVGTQS